MKINAHFRGESTIDGYGNIWIFDCTDSVGNFVNNGYNAFFPTKCNEIVLSAIPNKIDLTGAYDFNPLMGWIRVNFKDKSSKIFVDFKKQGELFVSKIIG
jgi:hypothetical protein